MTIAQIRPTRPRLAARQRRGAALAGLVSGLSLALESALVGVYLGDAGFAIADGEHPFGLADLAAAGVSVLLFAAACLLPWLILRRHRVLRSGAVAVTGAALTATAWLLVSVVAGVVAIAVAYATIIVVWGDSLFGPVLALAVVGVSILVVGIAIPLFLGMAKALQPRSMPLAEPSMPVATPGQQPPQQPVPPAIRL
jgi:hypothetical protein